MTHLSDSWRTVGACAAYPCPTASRRPHPGGGTSAGGAATTKVRKSAAAAPAIAAAVVLWGGYGRGWQWTGLPANDQLWDWLQILLLPVVLGTIPLWMQDRKYISRGRRVSYAVAIAAWTGFVIAGYLVPQMHWTGFSDRKLGDWLQLLLLPRVARVRRRRRLTIRFSRRRQVLGPAAP
jgi:hypothetical protein